jgi:hypothetical protein
LEVAEEADVKWGKARQKIFTTGSAREVFEVPAFSFAYVPIQMSLPIQFLWHTSKQLQSTVAVDGDCNGVETNYDPSVYQLFEPGRLGGRVIPASLHEDFRTGNLRITVQVGNRLLRVDPALLKPLKRVPARFWSDVHVGELYENPETMYLPRKRD